METKKKKIAKRIRDFYVKTVYGTEYYYQTERDRYYYCPLGYPEYRRRISKKEFEYRATLSIGGIKKHGV